jgi:hypothetical protein
MSNAAINLFGRHRREFARAVANRKFEVTPTGILFPEQKCFVMGSFEHTLNGKDRQVDPNLIPTEGLTHILSVVVAGGTQVNPWYVALFSANVTPQATLTAANFTATQTEFTGYDETTRVAYVEGTPAAGAVDNDASRAEFTINASATIYGAALISASAKSATSGSILACAKFSAGRAVVDNDTLEVKYSLSATSS